MKLIKLECTLMNNNEILFNGRSLGFLSQEETDKYVEYHDEEGKTRRMLGNFTSMDTDEALEIWNSLTADNDNDMADDHFDMWEKVENSFTIKQLAEQI